jgi:hypothetical protein
VVLRAEGDADAELARFGELAVWSPTLAANFASRVGHPGVACVLG